METQEIVVVAGHSCIDLVPALTGDLSLAPGEFSNVGPLALRGGGSVVNTGEALVALGRRIRVVSVVGDDYLGHELAGRLRQLDADALVETVALGTSYSLVLEQGGDSRTIWHHEGSNAAFTGDDIDPTGVALVHLGYATALPALIGRDLTPFAALLARTAAAGATSSVDFATLDVRSHDVGEWTTRLASIVALADVVSPSADDLVSLGWLAPGAGRSQIADGARRMIEAGAAVAFVTDGERGAHLAVADRARLARGGRVLARLGDEWNGADLWIPAVPVDRVVHTNGAGDTATAGLIHALLSGYTPQEAGRAAVALAAERVAGRDLRVAAAP